MSLGMYLRRAFSQLSPPNPLSGDQVDRHYFGVAVSLPFTSSKFFFLEWTQHCSTIQGQIY